ncbi:MAG: tellurite resistance TerB family protein [Acetobacteraceae bacterium]|nr:tellurite resistance TerB family protein [Acetobacteraceae bacterium]
MFDALKVLGSIAESQSASSAGNRFGSAVQQGAGGGILGQVLGQVFGGGPASGGAAAGGAAGRSGGGFDSLLGSLMNSGTPASGGAPASGGLGPVLGAFVEMARRAAASPTGEIQRNNPVAAGGLGGLAGALLGGGRGALGGGLLAVLGSLAVSVLQAQGSASAAGQQTAGRTAGPGPGAPVGIASAAALPQSPAGLQQRATLILRAMIQAAKADGVVDQQELGRIMGEIGMHGHDDEARDFVAAEIRRPLDIGSLVRDVSTPQEAIEVYAASILAIDVDTKAEQDYLVRLAAALQLPAPVMARVNAALNVPV